MAKQKYTQEEIDEMVDARDQIAEALNTLKQIARQHGERSHEAYVLAHLDIAVGEGSYVDKYEDTLAKWISEAEENLSEDEDEDEEDE